MKEVLAFLDELEEYCYTTSIITFLNSRSEMIVLEVKRAGPWIFYGEQDIPREEVAAEILRGCQPGAALILRSFTSEIDEVTQLPIKELRGYALIHKHDQFAYHKLSPEKMFAYQNTHSETGEPLPLEQAVKYC